MGFGLISLNYITDPNSVASYATACLIIISALFKSISHDSLFAKNIPKDIRGTMHGIYTFFATLGGLWFSKLGGYMHDYYGPASPFLIVAIIDFGFAIVVFILGLCKKFNQ